MKIYKTKAKKLAATNYEEAHRKARNYYDTLKHSKRTKKMPSVQSAFFNQKILLDEFWKHLGQKNVQDRARRLKYFICGIELIKNSKCGPSSKENINKKTQILHRFMGSTSDNEIFYVQIREDKKTGKKYLMSIYPDNE